jgi:hypothetical protein
MNMDLRIWHEVKEASEAFAFVEAYPIPGGALVKAALHTTVGSTYIVNIHCISYPNQMPTVTVTRPALNPDSPHRYENGRLCYMHPARWNPGQHNLTYVLARIAKWFSKYEVWRVTGRWPGAEIEH